MTQRRRKKRQKQRRHGRHVGLGRKRIAVGTGLSVGAALGMTATAEATDFTVINTNPSGGGSLAQAIIDANNGGGSDRILFQSGLSGTITLTSDLIGVDEPLQVLGPGANVLTISGNSAHRIFYVTGGGNLTVSGLTLTNGYPSGSGGAILSFGTLTVQDSNISGNTAAAYSGGGIYASGTLTVQRSTVSENTPDGIRTRYATDHIQNSTISANVGSYGLHPSFSSMYLDNTTVAGNGGSGIYAFDSDVFLTSTVLADSQSSDLSGFGSSFHAGFSLIENTGGNTISSTGPNITGADPALGPLGSNGGPTPTNRPSNTSLLLDKGSGGGTDQRGQPRPFDIASIPNAAGGNGADIGAVELQAADFASPAAPTPTTPTTPKKKKCKKKKHKRSADAAKKKKCKKKKKK
jgi:predicted outer membrane repeat protein